MHVASAASTQVFKDRTTITIAHRLDTIIFSDRVLAMSTGQLREFDAPDKLLRNQASMFSLLVEDTGPHASATLKRMAAEGPKVCLNTHGKKNEVHWLCLDH
jgi:ABC-type multidrug transport system ATPase subunit